MEGGVRGHITTVLYSTTAGRPPASTHVGRSSLSKYLLSILLPPPGEAWRIERRRRRNGARFFPPLPPHARAKADETRGCEARGKRDFLLSKYRGGGKFHFPYPWFFFASQGWTGERIEELEGLLLRSLVPAGYPITNSGGIIICPAVVDLGGGGGRCPFLTRTLIPRRGRAGST